MPSPSHWTVENMANGDNGRKGWQFARDVIQYALIPLLGIGWWQLNSNIERNAELLRNVSNNQIRVMAEIGSIKTEISEHEEKQIRESIDRGRVHHTTQKSCIECKIMGRDQYPLPSTNNKRTFP